MTPFLFRRIRGPVFLLCFALTAILAQWDVLSFARSWPIYLIAAGLLRLLDALLPFQPALTSPYGQPVVAGIPYVRRSSITLSVAELVFGVVALLVTTDVLALPDFWHVYATWWPLLLIVIGVLLLIERFFDGVFDRRAGRRFGPAAAYYPRRRRRGGLVFLVILVALLGLVGHHAPFVSSDNWRWDPDWNWSLSGETHENDVTLEQPIAADAALTVDNARGDLELATATDGLIHLSAHQVAHVSDRGKSKAFADTRPELALHGSSATVTVPGRNGVEVRLVLAVPEGLLCTIRNHHGDISVSGLKRQLEINQDHGDVALDSLGGPVHVTIDHGDIHARALASDLVIDGHADDVTASDIGGKTQLNGDFFGDTELDGVKGAVSFHSNRTDLEAARMAGQLSLDSDDLKIAGASGGLKLHTRSKDVEVTDLSDDAEITDSNSDVSVATAKPLGALSIQNSTGDVTLSIPPGLGFSISGQTGDENDISSEYPLTQSSDGSRKTLTGQVGVGGPHLMVTTSHGDLTLRRNAATVEAPERPEHAEAPERPEKPEKPEHVRHLKTDGEPPASAIQ